MISDTIAGRQHRRGQMVFWTILVVIISSLGILTWVPDAASANGPSVSILNPVEGQINYRTSLDVTIGIENFILNATSMGGPNVPGEGHYHLYINGNMAGMYAAMNVTLPGLPSGDHQLKVELVNNDHSPLDPPVMALRNFTISDLRPSVTIDHPIDTGVIYSDSIDIELTLSDFHLNESAMGMTNKVGEGHLHIYINDNMVGMFGTESFELSDLPSGDHVLKAVLSNNDHTSLVGDDEMTMDSVHFTISDLRPSIDIVSPIDSSVLYQDRLDLEVKVDDLMLNSSAIGMENMVGEGHYHILINDVLIGPYTDTMVSLEGLPAGDHILKVSLHNNDHTPIVPSSMDILHFTISDLRPMIEIAEPMDGDIIYSNDLEIEVMVTEFLLNGSAVGMDNIEGEGHYHLYINDALIGPYAQTMVTLNDLPAGDHVLKVMLMNNDHTMLAGEGMFMDMVNFTIVDAMPSISIIKPSNLTIIYSGMLHVEVDVDGFMLNGSAIGMANKPGEGHFHIYVNDELIGPYADEMVTLNDLPAGDHVLKVMLMNNDHAMLEGDGMFMDMVHFTISDLRPQIRIMDPMEGDIIYDDMLNLNVDVMNFTLNGSRIGQENMVGEGHYHIYINGDLLGPFNETMIMLEDLPVGDHELKVMLVNNDHSSLIGDEMLMDIVHFTISDLRPSIEIHSPTDGLVIFGTDLTIEVIIDELAMNGSAFGMDNKLGEGHWHLYINDDLIGPYAETMVTLTDLPYGHHVLKVVLVQNDHSPITPMTSAMSSFHLMLRPGISITSPVNGTTLFNDTSDFSVSVTDFTLNASAIGKSNKPGEGHYHVYLDGNLVGPFADPTFTLTGLSEGTHDIKVELRNNDHSALSLAIMDSISIMVELPPGEVQVMIGPISGEDGPIEGVEVVLTYDGAERAGVTGSDGMVTIAVPPGWVGKEVAYRIEKEGFGTVQGAGTLGQTGTISGLASLLLNEEEEEDPSLLPILLTIGLIALVLIAVVFIMMRGKAKDTATEE